MEDKGFIRHKNFDHWKAKTNFKGKVGNSENEFDI